MKISEDELKKLILGYLEQNRLMTLATSFDNIPWAATVFFAYDQDLNLYFLSEEKTRKIKNIFSNPKVAVAINEIRHKAGKTIGIQLEGEAYLIDKEKKERGLKIFKKRFSWAEKYLNTHELFVVKPAKIIYLDDDRFGPGGKGELILK